VKRLHLIELEDQAWLPAPIRDGLTDYLSFMAELASLPFAGFAAKIDTVMKSFGTNSIVEMGSGGGGPAISICRELIKLGRKDVKLTLTDLHPNVPRLRYAKEHSNIPISVVEHSVDATSVPDSLDGLRLMCNAFHHLPPHLAREVLHDALRKNKPIAIMELVSRSTHGFAQLFAGIPLMFIMMLFVRPFRISRLFFTYVIPLIPFCTLWDGVVSCLRVYSPEEMRELVESLPKNSFNWDIGIIKVPMAPIRVTYLIGTPD
jgi:hypothetical protein